MSCQCECKFDGRKCNSNQKWNNSKCRFERENSIKHHACEKDFTWNSSTCRCKNGRYTGSTIDDSVVTCDQIIEMTKTVPSKSTSKTF